MIELERNAIGAKLLTSFCSTGFGAASVLTFKAYKWTNHAYESSFLRSDVKLAYSVLFLSLIVKQSKM